MTGTRRGTAAVYNQFWETGGGGETFCGGIAQALAAAGFTTTLLAHRDFDRVQLGERLSLDLSQTPITIVDEGPRAVGAASADFDLFVNGSYLSSAVNRATVGLYVVHFPGTRPAVSRLGPVKGFLADHHPATVVDFAWGEGFHPPDGGSAGAVWTSGKAELTITVTDDSPLLVSFEFAHLRPPALGPTDVRIIVDGIEAGSGSIPAAASGLAGRVRSRIGTRVQARVPPGTHAVAIECEPFIPADVVGGNDTRSLGVGLASIHSGSSVARAMASVAPSVYHRLSHQAVAPYIDSYDVVASNSAFTKQFVEAWWRIADSPVLYPPVVLRQQTQAKTQSIVAIGRFFEAAAGHSKKQIELVQAFRRLRAHGIDDWTLHLVGGCDAATQGYLDRVRAEAEGLPVEFHVNASGAERDHVMQSAAIFWHATGFGENSETHPERMEHFGISTVEAMSAGAIPVVYAGGGQLEIVEAGVNGFHFRTLDDLVAHTRTLIDDPTRRAAMADAAAARAEHFGVAAFSARLLALVDGAMEQAP